MFDAFVLLELPFVRHVRQDGPRHFTVVVDDAGTATPDVVEAVGARGGEVVSAREERPSFDEVFADARRARRGSPEPGRSATAGRR